MEKVSTVVSENIHKMNQLAITKSFLSKEFLTWLWYQSETHPDGMKLKVGAVQFWVDDKVILESPQTTAHIHTIRGGTPSQSAEAATALKSGKLVRELKLGLNIHDVGEFGAILDCRDVSPRALRLPATYQGEATYELSVRLELTRTFFAVLDELYALFMKDRTDAQWESRGMEKLKTWVGQRQAHESAHWH